MMIKQRRKPQWRLVFWLLAWLPQRKLDELTQYEKGMDFDLQPENNANARKAATSKKKAAANPNDSARVPLKENNNLLSMH